MGWLSDLLARFRRAPALTVTPMNDAHLLSPNFLLSDFTRSQTATRYGLDNSVVYNSPVYLAAADLCAMILEPLRAHFGSVTISSGYRSREVNAKVGGAPTSQHCLGQAADVLCPGHSVREVTEWIAASTLPFDQLIYEFGESGWTHVSYLRGKPARTAGRILTAQRTPSGVNYLPGIT